MGQIFTDSEVREVVRLYYLNFPYENGDDIDCYQLAKIVRDAIEKKLTADTGKELSNREIILRLTAEII